MEHLQSKHERKVKASGMRARAAVSKLNDNITAIIQATRVNDIFEVRKVLLSAR